MKSRKDDQGEGDGNEDVEKSGTAEREEKDDVAGQEEDLGLGVP